MFRFSEERLLGHRFHRRSENAAGRHERELTLAQGIGSWKLKPCNAISRSEENRCGSCSRRGGVHRLPVAKAYVEAGPEVLVRDNLPPEEENVAEGARFVLETLVETAVEALGPSGGALCHHAAQINVRRSYPIRLRREENIVSRSFFSGGAGARVRKVIFSSSGGAGTANRSTSPRTKSTR